MRPSHSFRLGLESEKIRCLAPRVAEPADYFTGKGALNGNLPGRILCFVRKNASDLNERPSLSKPHQHHRCVFIAAIQGEGRVRVDADTFPLKEGEAKLICPFQYHSYTGVCPENICWVFITFEVADPDLIEPLRSRSSSPMGPTEMLLLGEILQCWTGSADDTLLAFHFALLLRRLCAVSEEPALLRQPEADLVAQINGYALPRLDQPFRLKELSAALGESESHMRAKFRRLTGESLGHHLRQLRLRRACQMLVTTEASITEVAGQCGFDSVYSFSRSFKTSCGMSPRAYREKNHA